MNFARTLVAVLFACRLHISLFTLAAVWGWSRLFATQVLPEDYLIAPLIMSCVYLWNRAWDLQEDSINCPDSTRHFERARHFILALAPLIGVVCIGLAALRGPLLAPLALVVILLVGFAYSAPFLPGRPNRRLKDFCHVKNLTSALGWVVLVTLYPALHAAGPLSAAYLLGSVILFLAVWTVEIIWDIRDVEGDRQAGVITLPVALGPAGANRWIWGLNILGAITILAGLGLKLLPQAWYLALVNNALIAGWARLGADRLQQGRFWSHGLVVAQTGLIAAAGFLALWLQRP